MGIVLEPLVVAIRAAVPVVVIVVRVEVLPHLHGLRRVGLTTMGIMTVPVAVTVARVEDLHDLRRAGLTTISILPDQIAMGRDQNDRTIDKTVAVAMSITRALDLCGRGRMGGRLWIEEEIKLERLEARAEGNQSWRTLTRGEMDLRDPQDHAEINQSRRTWAREDTKLTHTPTCGEMNPQDLE